ncbi:MAG: helix-turn-helix domain-containing protein [Clostridiaceae bacterium]|nr:helix-turn-helix domain-containing protein [Clostridiaceae bacterium]
MENIFKEKIRQIILDHLDDEKFNVNKLSSEMGWSNSHTYRKVRSITGISLNQYIKETRLKEAAKLILNSNDTASEISYKVGFSSPSYFNKCFSKYYGVTPGEYKEKSEKIPPVNDFEQTNFLSRIKKFQYIFYILGAILLIIGVFSFFKSKNNSSEKSIAVLYFDDHSPESDLQWLCDGLTGEIIENLAGIKTILVASRTSVKQFRNSDIPIDEIAKILNVDYILESSVSKSKFSDSIRIFTELINLDDKHVWSNSYDETIENSLKLQNDVSKLIVEQLNVSLSPEEAMNIEKHPTNNKQAYNLFLKADYQHSLFNKLAFEKAIPLFEQAIALDSNFIEAYVGLAEIWQIGGGVWGLYDEQESRKESKQLLLKAMSIDSTNNQIEYNLHLGYFYYDWNFEAMEKYYQKRLLKSHYDNFTGVILDYAIKTGRYNEAFLINERYIKNFPKVSHLYIFKAEILMFLGKKDALFEIFERYNSMFSDDLYYLRGLTKLYFYLEEYEKSRNQLKNIRIIFPNENPPILIWLDAVFAKIDTKNEDAKLYVDQLKNLYDKHRSGSPAWFIALYYCYFEDYENTFIWLQKSYDRHDVEMTWLQEEPLLIPLRNDERYKELHHKIGFSKIK